MDQKGIYVTMHRKVWSNKGCINSQIACFNAKIIKPSLPSEVTEFVVEAKILLLDVIICGDCNP